MEITIDQAFKKAVLAHQEGKIHIAENIYTSILRARPLHPDANHNLGLIASAVNKHEVALDLYKVAFEEESHKYQFWASYVGGLIKCGRLEVAETVTDLGRDFGFSEASVHYLHSKISLSRGLVSQAKQRLEHVIKLQPNHVEAHFQLGITLLQLKEYQSASVSLREAIGLRTGHSESYNALGSALMSMDVLPEAEECFRKAIELQKGFILAHRNLAKLLRKLKRHEEADESERCAIYLFAGQAKSPEHNAVNAKKSIGRAAPLEYPLLYRAGMGTENVGGFLRAMAQMVRPMKILEIGAGYTTPFLLEALVNNQRVYDDGNLQGSYFKNYKYEPKLVVIDNMSLGELREKPGMRNILTSEISEFLEGEFEGKSLELQEKYGSFDFVWFDCGGLEEYQKFFEEYWCLCSDYVFFHFTFSDGVPNDAHKLILNSVPENADIFDIVEPHKRRQGSITMVRKKQ